MTTEDNSPATRLIPHREKDPADIKVLGIIAGLPQDTREGRAVLVGICNGAGEVYRRVELFGALELVLFAARMNAAGFANESGTRSGKPSYDVVFRRPGRRGSPTPAK